MSGPAVVYLHSAKEHRSEASDPSDWKLLLLGVEAPSTVIRMFGPICTEQVGTGFNCNWCLTEHVFVSLNIWMETQSQTGLIQN